MTPEAALRRGPGPFLLPASPITDLAAYVEAGGGRAIDAARSLGPERTITLITTAGLRGRGGGGFLTGTKWASVRAGAPGTRYVVANGAEGEPASFKDRTLMRRDPFRILEGAAVAAFAVGASQVFVATKRSFAREVDALSRAAVALSGSGIAADLTITIVEGPDEYLFGEEKALLEVIEGREPLPRLLPPWQLGLFATAPAGGWESEARGIDHHGEANPTVVNNVETLATVAHILANGADWFRSMGTDRSPGTLVATVVGDVRRPGVHEVECGTPFDELLLRCGGPHPGRRLVAAFSGVSNPVLTADRFATPLTYEDFVAVGSGLGAAGFAVYDDSRDMTAVAREFSRFLAVESCGQCPACKQGCLDITERLTVIGAGDGDDRDLAVINASLRSVTDGNRCAVGAEEQTVVSSILRAFPGDVASRLSGAGPMSAPVLIPLIKDIDDHGSVTYDERHASKQPDWTYAQ